MAGGDHRPRRNPTASTTSPAVTRTLRPALPRGVRGRTTIPSKPALAAAIATVRMPGSSQLPLRETPREGERAEASFGSAASPRARHHERRSSRALPSHIGRARFTTTRLSGIRASRLNGRPDRSRASCTPAPGSPVTMRAGARAPHVLHGHEVPADAEHATHPDSPVHERRTIRRPRHEPSREPSR